MPRRWTFVYLLFLLPALKAAEPKCAGCHPAEVENFSRNAMARSLSVIAGQPDGRLHHARSDSDITIRHDAQGTMIQRVSSHGLTAEYPIAYAVGAGKVGFSYLISLPPFLFQSPVSYYTKGATWDVTPGYEPERVLDFTHPITQGCVFCHAGVANLVPGSESQFQQPALSPISCERCHGDAQTHLKNPIPGSIVNPRKLPPPARDSVCEQCHLEGQVRILNSGKHWNDFRAGAELESVFSTYVRPTPVSAAEKAVSHAEQLALSRCARQSKGQLWCGTCHNPHSNATNRAQEVRGVCLSCHAAVFTAKKHQPAEECVSCHMPNIRPLNVAHAAVTSHRISIPSSSPAQPAAEPNRGELTAWREPPAEFVQRNLGLALFQDGSTMKDADEIYRSYQILAHLPQRGPQVLASLGSILLQQKHVDLAAKLYEQALALEPRNARFAYVWAVALAAQGDREKAISKLRLSIQLDPLALDPYRKLSEIYDQMGQHALSEQVSREYLKVMPQNLLLREHQ